MALEDGEIGWFSPDPRGVIPLDAFHVPRRLQRVVRSEDWTVRVDTRFEEVMHACAERPGEGTWISDEILESYVALHRQGMAHSVEVWRDDALVGGLYGVHLGGAFFGESMFHRARDASKVALVSLVDRLQRARLRSARHPVDDPASRAVRSDGDTAARVFAQVERSPAG